MSQTAHLVQIAASLSHAGKEDEAIVCYERALKLAPEALDVTIALGMLLSQMGHGERARPWLETAQQKLTRQLPLDPQNTETLNRLGTVLQRLGRLEEAVGYYQTALAINPYDARISGNLAINLRDLNRLEEAVAMGRHALHVMPESAEAWLNLGVFLQEMGRHPEAIDCFEQALQRDQALFQARQNKAFSLLALGRYEEGWQLYETGLGIVSLRGKCPFPERLWRGEEITGKRLLLWCEQGLGDDLQFIRYAALCKARAGTVIVQCPAPLRRLFANCPFIDQFLDEVAAQDFDVHAPLMSLPYVFRTTLNTIPSSVPYLRISAATRRQWRDRFADSKGVKIGLVWAGKPHIAHISTHLIDKRRSLSLRQMRPLFEVAGVCFYNLQLGAADVPRQLIDWMPDVKDFEDTAAIIENLDLVISVDTSVAHLAGGMGKPVWILSRFDACWRWLQNRPDSPWYPTARVFGQTTAGDWISVIDRMRTELITFAAHRTP
jgi:tetratricopeptide (TPR) repeat protein